MHRQCVFEDVRIYDSLLRCYIHLVLSAAQYAEKLDQDRYSVGEIERFEIQ